MNPLRKSLFVLLPAALLALAGCTSNSPSEPKVDPVPPVPPTAQITYNITVTANPSTLAIGSGQSSTITVRVVRADNGQPPANLTPITVATTLGTFGSAGGESTVTLQLTNGSAQTVLFPGTSSGVATVRATLDRSEGFANVQIGAGATFFIAFVQPSVIDPQGGETVTIQGGGFEDPVRVTVGAANVQVLSVSPDRIRIITPSAVQAGVTVSTGQAIPVNVSVTINVNEPEQKTDNLAAGLTYATGGGGVQPVITSVTPSSGSNDGGTRITINGSGFQSPVQVFFEGGSPRISVEAPVESVSANRVIVLSPAARGFGQGLQNQSVDIRVKNINSGFEGSTSAGFRYGSNVLITAVGPTEVVYNVPTQVTIQGQGFDEPLTVGLGGFAAFVQSVTGTRIVARSPIVSITSCAAVVGSPLAQVTNIETGDSSTAAGSFRYRPIDPVITGVSPSNGAQGGNTLVTLTSAVGTFTGFESPLRVTFGGQPASIVSVTPGSVVVRTPPFSGAFLQETCTSGSLTGMRNAPTPVPVVVTNLTTGCDDTIANGFSYLPSDTTCHVTPPAPPVANFTFSSNGLTTIFADSSSGAPTSWLWNFGDPASGGANASGQQNPVHNFSAAGTYTVSLTVANAGGSSTKTQFVTVPPP
ncbi:MAG: IPT/TIG domain-containing protein [Acidobacteriota bacterium]